MQASDAPFATIEEISAAYREGALDPRDCVGVFLARIARFDGKLHAFIEVYEREARAEAEASALRYGAGIPLGPLDGIPVAIKDLAEIEGRRTACGSAALTERISTTTATVVRRLRAAGALLLGKTHMVEFACGGWGTNARLGTPWNPWDLETHRVPGGSSSGSAVAVAGGLATAAIGSDTGGSVRIPASLCGLTGLKTTVGRISNAGTMPLAKTLDTLGVLARSAHDAAQVYEAVRGPDPLDPATLGVEPDEPLLRIDAGIRGMRLGVLPSSEREGVDPEILAAYDAALDTFAKLGAQIAEVELPETFEAVRPRCGAVIMAEGYAATRDWLDDETQPLDPNVCARLLSGRETTLGDYLRLQEDRRRTKAVWNDALESVDALLTPSTPMPAVRLDEVDESAFTLARFTRAGNYLDWCGLAVPMGHSRSRLPLSLQICGMAYAESRVLRIAAAFQSATPHHRKRPAGLQP
jgi:aspartyl-tRNA(Asn)/glutamyl-tRNA(Gln) amidotransferase subunit A